MLVILFKMCLSYTVSVLRRNRLGIRLQGPRPQFARKDGGEGGSHPSNVHDHVYAIGTINFTGEATALITIPATFLRCACTVHKITRSVLGRCIVMMTMSSQSILSHAQATCLWR